MNYWEGWMNWKLNEDWKCEICGAHGPLIWGLRHARCRCDTCHTQYHMRDKHSNVVTTPICQLKPELKEKVKAFWDKSKIPLDEWTEEQAKEAIS